jgi:peroxin-2
MLIRVRTAREPTDPAIVRAIRLVMGQQAPSRGPSGVYQRPEEVTEAQAARLAVSGPEADYARARQIVLRTRGQEDQRGGGHATQTSIGAATASVPRVFQLDGERVESEIGKLILGQIGAAFDALNSPLPYQWADELKLAVAAVFYRYGVWETSQSFGDKLMNLVYRDERAAVAAGREMVPIAAPHTVPSRALKVMHMILTILLPYLWKKLERHVLENAWATQAPDAPPRDGDIPMGDAQVPTSDRVINSVIPPGSRQQFAIAIKRIGAALGALEVLHFCAFLLTGHYRSLVDRVLGMRLVLGRQRMARQVSLYYMNQSLFWQVVLGFASVVLPLLQLGRIFNLVANFRTPWSATREGRAVGGSGEGRLGGADHCVFCGVAASGMVMPRALRPCHHATCYSCWASRAKANAAAETSDLRTSVLCPTCDVAADGVTFLRADDNVARRR